MDIVIKARAKINLYLEVTGLRADGYHGLRTVMQTVYLHDRLVLRRIAQKKLELRCDTAYLPVDGRNLVFRAARYMMEAFSLPGGLFISLKKGIPVSAGLAGGSADCAAAIRGVDCLFGLKLTQGEMMGIGGKFGADVPFCLLGGTALAEGRGDILTALPPHPPVTVVIAKPPAPVSTPVVFKAYDSVKHSKGKDINLIISNIKQKNIQGITSGFYNALEDVTVNMCPDVAKLKGLYLDSGAAGALMSGSGPSVFAYFNDQGQAWGAMKKVGAAMPHIKQYLTGVLS